MSISTAPSSHARRPSSASPASSPPAHSPTSPHALHHAQQSSHAALLSGVRSHALPHSPTLAATPDAVCSPPPPSTRARSKSFGPSSPPFGPTPTLLHHPPSPLGLELSRAGSPERELAELVRGGPPDDMYGDDGRLPGAFESRASSPPLLPIRDGTFGRASPLSPASLYLEKEAAAAFGQCDLRTSPQEQRATSPPPSPPLFHAAKVLPPPSVSSPSAATAGSAPTGRARARSFTSERNFAPATSASPPPVPSLQGELHPPPLILPPLVSAAVPPSTDDALLPPASPHQSTIALPPPPVAPAPLPAHLGGPPLHHPRHLGPKLARAHSSALADKLASGPGSEFVPKRHSPLASPALEADLKEAAQQDSSLGHESCPPEDESFKDGGGDDGGEERRERSASPPPPQITLVDPVEHVERRASHFGALGFMDVDSPTLSGQVPSHEPAGSEDGEVISIDEESLSSLERIFVCAKSSAAEERARVAHNLADWLVTVSMEEAVEYVLPLLAGLATDSEELVKEVFAPQLDRIMWHFFSQCPLVELDSADGDSDRSPDSPVGSPVPSRYTPLPPPKSPPSTVTEDSSSAYTPPTTTKTSPSNTEVSDAPRISATTFTSLLGALLTDQSTVVANSTQTALVRFLCRLKGKPPPSPSPSPSLREPATGLAPYERPSTETQLPAPYHLTEDARRVLEDEVVNGIVLGLARLDDDDRDGGPMDLESDSRRSRSRSPLPASESTLVLSPEEEQIEDGWLGAEQDRSQAPGPTTESWGEPLVSYYNAPPVEPKGEYGSLPEGSPQVYSSFSPDGGQGDEESAIGKLVSMSLVAAIAQTDCLEPDVLAMQILPEVERMRSEQMFYVRKEAATALGSLARTLPLECFESSVLPLHAAFARDTLWHVRRAACVSLPTLFKRLPPALLRSQTIANVVLFGNDESRNVRNGLLEVSGELIYLFHGDPSGVPSEMLDFYLGRLALPPTLTTDTADVFAPLPSALDSPPQTFYDSPPPWGPTGTLFAGAAQQPSRDPDRPVMCAFNLPAVVLTLGRDQWSLVADFYLTLCRDKADKVRQSLASSMHEVARIVGPQQADEHLVGPFGWFLHDFDHIQGAVLDNLASLVLAFGIDAGRQVLETVAESWGSIKQWRRREAVAKQLAGLGGHFLVQGTPEEFLGVLVKAFKDPVASVRDNAVYAIPNMFAATEQDPLARSKLWAFLAVFSEDSGYRHRTTYTSCAYAAVRGGCSRELFESYFLDALSRLARDPVVNVRIGVARVVAEACRSPSLYADPAARSPLDETLHHLFHSSDRDVVGAVAEFCAPPAPSSPPQNGFDRSGALSRLSMYDEDHDDEYCLPSANMNRNSYGAGETDMEDVELPRSPPPDGMLVDDDAEMVERDAGEGEGEESGGSLRRPVLWTQELEGEESFLEVSRR